MSDPDTETAALARRLAAEHRRALELDALARAPQLRELALAMHEAAHAPRSAEAPPLERVGDVIAALANAAAELRLATWGYPHPGSVGDLPLVVVANGDDLVVREVRVELGRLVVELNPHR